MRKYAAAPRLSWPGDAAMRRVLFAYGLSRFTEFAGWLAILLVAYEAGGAGLVGVAAFAMQAPAILLVPILAGAADRYPRSLALTASYWGIVLTSGVVATLLRVGAPLWSVVLAGVAMTVAVFLVRPIHFAGLPLLARGPGDLVAANSWSSFMDGVAIFVGFVLASVVTEALGAWVVIAACAVLCLVAAVLTHGLSLPAIAIANGDAPSEVRAALAGLAVLRRSLGTVALLVLMACTSLLMGSNETLAVAFNDQVLGRPESTAGLVAGAFGLGIAVGGATISGLVRRKRLAPVVLAGAVLLGTAELSVAILGRLGPVVIVMMLLGIGIALVLVAARTLAQRSTDPDVLARVLAIQESAHIVGLAIGYLVGPLAIVIFGAQYAFVPMGMLVLAIALLSYQRLRALDAIAQVPEREIALLSAVPFLTGLPQYELERIARDAQWQAAPAGTGVVRQGEQGDTYYLVESGELSVTVDGVVRPEVLSAGDGFGEIALLHKCPRTATVTALSDSTLLVVTAADFLGAVMSSPEGELQAKEIARARMAANQQVPSSRIPD